MPFFEEASFRHEYSRLVSTLSRRYGLTRIEQIEDAVQSALLKALEHWPRVGEPERPSAWLYRVAKNQLLDKIKQQHRQREILAHNKDEFKPQEAVPDDLLAMLFVCCDPGLPQASRLVLALKILCGFSTKEIALRLFASEANVYKRLARGREALGKRTSFPNSLSEEDWSFRLDSVLRVVYLVFTEGYLSHKQDHSIRKELCSEAIRLGELLTQRPESCVAQTYALLALMHFHAARLASRSKASGDLQFLWEQDRTEWDPFLISKGLHYLELSAEGEAFSRYHAEAGVAVEHCLAPSFEETRWDRIVECYALLDRVQPSPIHRMNWAIALAELEGPEAGLQLLQDVEPGSHIKDSYQWSAVLGDLSRRAGKQQDAKRFCKRALEQAPTDEIREMLGRRFASP